MTERQRSLVGGISVLGIAGMDAAEGKDAFACSEEL